MNHEQATEVADGVAKLMDYNDTLTSSYVKRYLKSCKDAVIQNVKHATTMGIVGLAKTFQKHPKEVGQTYCAHFTETAKNAGRKLKEACSLFTHAVFPFIGTHLTYGGYTPKLAPKEAPQVESTLVISDRVLDALELATLDIVADTNRIREEIVVHQEIKSALQEALVSLAQQHPTTPPVVQDVKKWE